jgi:hypothetical protein
LRLIVSFELGVLVAVFEARIGGSSDVGVSHMISTHSIFASVTHTRMQKFLINLSKRFRNLISARCLIF